jgi:cell division protease FtsH
MKKNNKNNWWRGVPRNLFFAIALFVGFFILLQQLTDYSRHISTLSYTAFLDKVAADQVSKVYVAGQEVRGLLKDGSQFETVIGNQDSIWDLFQKHQVEAVVANTSNAINIWYFLPFLLFLFIVGFGIMMIIRQSRGSGGGGGGNIFSMGKSKAKMFMPATIKETFASVAGATEAKEELLDIIDFLRNPKKYKRLGAKITRGVLLVGEPGNGKTLLARAVAGEANCPFFSTSGSDFIEVFVGVGAARVRDLFAQARKNAPSILFIDEIDAVGRQRGSGMGGGHDEREQTLNQLLTEMDGFETTHAPVVVLAATNRPDVLDKALLRPGRFDRRVDVPYPDLTSREAILRIHAADVKLDTVSVDLKKVARGTPGFSGADLANLINEGAIQAAKQNKDLIDVKDLEEARDKMMLGKESKTKLLTLEDRTITAYHEAGHALMGLLQPVEADPLYKVTIIPRGQTLGTTHSLPEREKYTQSKDEMLADVMVSLGGRAAEELVFNKYTTGASSDMQSASRVVRNMICYYGMSDALGPIIYSQSQYEYRYSQKTAEKIDEEVRVITQECYEKTVAVLQENRDKLEKLAQALLEKETLFASEIYQLLDIEPRAEHRF